MAMHALSTVRQPHRDSLAAALCAAELGEPFDLVHVPATLFMELFAAVPRLKQLVPYATLRLLARLSSDERVQVRVGVARVLSHFAERYPQSVEEIALQLACDQTRRVRVATAESLASLLRVLDAPEELIARWQWHPDRAGEVLDRARRNLPELRRVQLRAV